MDNDKKDSCNDKKSIGRYISMLHKYFHTFIMARNREQGLNRMGRGQVLILYALAHKDGVSQEEISNFFKIDKGNIAKGIKQLILDGYVFRKRDPHDKRAYKIYLTLKGSRSKEDILKARKEWSSILSAGFSDEEKIIMNRLLNQMVDNVEMFLKEKETKG